MFARICGDFTQIISISKLLGMRLHHLHPRLPHHWMILPALKSFYPLSTRLIILQFETVGLRDSLNNEQRFSEGRWRFNYYTRGLRPELPTTACIPKLLNCHR